MLSVSTWTDGPFFRHLGPSGEVPGWAVLGQWVSANVGPLTVITFHDEDSQVLAAGTAHSVYYNSEETEFAKIWSPDGQEIGQASKVEEDDLFNDDRYPAHECCGHDVCDCPGEEE